MTKTIKILKYVGAGIVGYAVIDTIRYIRFIRKNSSEDEYTYVAFFPFWARKDYMSYDETPTKGKL
jgi:hypothetical protein